MPRYDWNEVQRYYDEGHTYIECRAMFGFTPFAWTKAVWRGAIKPRSHGIPLERLLREGKSRSNIKRRLLLAGHLKNECSICGLSEWLGEPLSVHIDHINGDKQDFRLENLRMLCPNCHSQTPTFSGRNVRRKPK